MILKKVNIVAIIGPRGLVEVFLELLKNTFKKGLFLFIPLTEASLRFLQLFSVSVSFVSFLLVCFKVSVNLKISFPCTFSPFHT